MAATLYCCPQINSAKQRGQGESIGHLLGTNCVNQICIISVSRESTTPSKDVDKVIFFSAGNRNILFKHNILCIVEFYGGASGSLAPREATEDHVMDLSIAYPRRSFRNMTLRFLVLTQVNLAIACRFRLFSSAR